jgi:hypothetical protein
MYTCTYERGDTVFKTELLAMVNMTVLKIVRGTRVRLAGDGTHSMFPKAAVSYRKRFDKIEQLYTVHVILEKKVDF